MRKFLFFLSVCLIGANIVVKADNPQVIELTEVVVSNPKGGPQQGTGGNPGCYTCFTATISNNVLSVRNDAQETVNVVVTNMTTNNVVLSTPVTSDLEEQLPSGYYRLHIIPQTYAPMEGFFVAME